MSSVTAVQMAVAAYFDTSVIDLMGRTESSVLRHARAIAYYLERAIGGLTYSEIARLYGERDRTTVMSGYKGVERKLKVRDSFYETHVEALREELVKESKNRAQYALTKRVTGG